MISGPRMTEGGEWCADVEEGFAADFEHALRGAMGGGATARHEGTTFYFPKGMKAPEVMKFWNDWVASGPQYKPPRTGKNPVDQTEYVEAHGRPPMGIRRWRFICRSAFSNESLLDIEADGEYSFVVQVVQELARREVGDCTVEVMATSGPPRPSGEPLQEAPLPGWELGTVRPFWIDLRRHET